MPNGVTFSPPQPPAPLTNVLTDTHIFVGDAANVPQDVALTLNATGGAFALANTGVLTMPNADAVTRGLLTAADWNTFNNKQNAIADWTTAFNSGTQATSSWSATNAAANVNAAIIPKGTGALIASIPDGAITGGNARGTYAVDFQMSRSAATQVASGIYSVIAGGIGNTVSNEYSNVGGGVNNSIAGKRSVIAGGSGNSMSQGSQFYMFIGGGSDNQVNNDGCAIAGGFANISGRGGGFTDGYGFVGGGESNRTQSDRAAVVCGLSNTASGSKSFIGGGQSNTASGSHSTIGGGQNNTVNISHGFVGGGNGNTASGGAYNVVVGGSSNTCSGTNQHNFIGGGTQNSISGNAQDAVNCGGRSNVVSGLYAFNGAGRNNSVSGEGAANLGRFNVVSGSHANVLGGQENTAGGTYAACISSYQGTANLYGQHIHASGRFTANGDAQAHELVWRAAVTGSPVGGTELFLDGSSAAAILPSTNAIWHGIIDIAAICTATGNGTTVTGDVEATSYKVTIKRIGTNTVLVGTVQEIGTTNADASIASGVFTIDNNNTNESLRIVYTSPVTAGSTTTIRVVATFRGLQIQY